MCVRELDISCVFCCLWRPEKGGSLVLESQEILNHLMQVLRTELWSSTRVVRTARDLNQRPISLAPLTSCLDAKYSTLVCKQI